MKTNKKKLEMIESLELLSEVVHQGSKSTNIEYEFYRDEKSEDTFEMVIYDNQEGWSYFYTIKLEVACKHDVAEDKDNGSLSAQERNPSLTGGVK